MVASRTARRWRSKRGSRIASVGRWEVGGPFPAASSDSGSPTVDLDDNGFPCSASWKASAEIRTWAQNMYQATSAEDQPGIHRNLTALEGRLPEDRWLHNCFTAIMNLIVSLVTRTLILITYNNPFQP